MDTTSAENYGNTETTLTSVEYVESGNLGSSSNNFQTMADSQGPIEDPSNSPEVNAKRKQELEAVRKLNSAVQTINSNLEHSKANLQVG
jgi:hypothetical protein